MKERQEKINWKLSKERNDFGMKEGKEEEKEQVTKCICSETGNGACAVLSSWLKSVHIFIHYAVCLATDPQPLEGELSGVSSVVLSVSNSSIIFLFYLRSHSSCLRRLPRIINPSIFPSMYKCWNKIKLWNYGKPIRGSNFQKGKETFLQVVGPTHKYGDYFPGDEAAGALRLQFTSIWWGRFRKCDPNFYFLYMDSDRGGGCCCCNILRNNLLLYRGKRLLEDTVLLSS